jgi:formylglycine-generating enzyme required for sulfatase activity
MNDTNIKQRLQRLVLIGLLVVATSNLFAHGVEISNVELNGQNTTSDFTFVNFDIAWDNSWRTSTAQCNWDACWVFVKYRLKIETTWHHATLNWVDGTGSGDGHTEPTNSNIVSSNDNGSGGAYGVFIYSSADMAQGSVNYTGAKLRWNYGTDGLADNDSVEVCVFAIEMVYVPQGSFYVGDGTFTTIRGQFENGTSGTALQITSEGALTLGGGSAGSLGNSNTSGMYAIWGLDDFNDATSKTLPAAFPKGYNAFYCMKYEITQEQYAAFLNKLTYTQQTTRTVNAPNSAPGTGALNTGNSHRNGIDIMTKGISSYKPAVYACNLDGDANYDEATDGQNISCNYLKWDDLAAYLDWAALRPFTELEYEKACRGTIPAVANEYAWGSISLTQATGISNSGANNETASNAAANCAYGNHASVQGPMRVGNFGQGVNTKIGVGASYYGIMEMSGNNWERPISVSSATSRAFTGTNGNGILLANGNADASNWTSGGFRGGDWNYVATCLRISDRYCASYTFEGWPLYFYGGGRGVRVAP